MEAPQITFSSEKKKPLKIGSSEYLSANDFSLTEREKEKARRELYETEEKKVKKLQELRNKLASDNDVNYRTDTPYLLRFLRVRKYDSTKAFQNIREGYLFKKKYPQVSQISENLEELLNLNIFVYLPYTDEQGNVLFYIDLEKWKCQETSLEEAVQILSTTADIISMNPKMQVNGVIGIWDANALTAQHVAVIFSRIGPRAFTFYMQNMYPWRMKNLLIINTGRLTRLFFKMVRPFLSKKISERINLLGSDIKELHRYVNPVLLPKKLGGSLEDNQCSVTQNVMDNISYLKYEKSFS